MAKASRGAQRLDNPSRNLAGDVVGRVQRATGRVWGESLFYQAQLKGPAPDRLLCQPVDPRTPDRALAEAMTRGRLAIGAESYDVAADFARLWDVARPGGAVFRFLHEFAWLRHFAALGEAGREPARLLTQGWLDRCERWASEAWAPELTGERLAQLCCHSGLVLAGAEVMRRSRLLASMARQTRHLARCGHRADGDYARLAAAAGLALAGLCLPGCEPQAERGLELLRRELRLQLRPDGGHVSRNPSLQLAIVLRLQMVVKALEARRMPAPGFLRHAVGRAAATVQFFRAGDGHLAVFNGGCEDDSRAVVSALQSIDPDLAPPGFARHTGYQRIEAARALVIADTGPGRAPDRYDGAGSIHFSSGRNRIVVNCGGGDHLSPDWARALRQAAAHSGLSSEPPGAAALLSCGAVQHRRAEDSRGQLLEIERSFDPEAGAGPRHIRRLFLSAHGEGLRGEDRLVAPPAALAAGWRLRFHLHPTVKASLARDGRSVILALANREGWRFRTSAPNLRLERSVYCGAGGLPVACEQIVLCSDVLEPEAMGSMVIKWAFRRLEGVWAAADLHALPAVGAGE